MPFALRRLLQLQLAERMYLRFTRLRPLGTGALRVLLRLLLEGEEGPAGDGVDVEAEGAPGWTPSAQL